MFRLLRYFSVTSAVALIAVTFALVYLYRDNAMEGLVVSAEGQNISLARSFANNLWPRFSHYVMTVSETDGEKLRARPETAEIDQAVRALTAGLPVLKVKIYNLDGRTIYSSQPSQIGADKSHNPSFLKSARAGNPESKFSFRENFSAFSDKVFNRSLVESYLPIWGDDDAVEGVFELYTDVTPLVAKINRSADRLTVGLLMTFALLYGILILIVRRADKIIRWQYADLSEAKERIKEKNASLEREIDERERIGQALATAKTEAELANRTKSEFLANMSHELRTPLNAILGFSELMGNATLGPLGNPKYEEYTKDINDSGRHLLALINDILDLSKIEAGKHELDEEDIDIAMTIRSCLVLVKERAKNGEVQLQTNFPEGLPALHADARKFKQILVNLLSNAIKFTPAGGEVTLKAWWRPDSGYVFQIIDTGIGIELKDIPRALAPFGQIESHLNREYEGTGLGLPLTKSLVESHGGSLDLQSQISVGTTVTVRFPEERIVQVPEVEATGSPAA